MMEWWKDGMMGGRFTGRIGVPACSLAALSGYRITNYAHGALLYRRGRLYAQDSALQTLNPWFARCVTVVMLAVYCTGCKPEPQKAWLLDMRGKTLEEKVSAYAVQGIANRKGPRVFIRLGEDCRWMQMDYETGKRPAIWSADDVKRMKGLGIETIEDAWISHLTQKRGFTFEPITLEALIAKCGDDIKGALVYDTIREDIAPVATWAGLRDLIPVTTNRYGLAVAEDYREVKKKLKGDKRLAGHQWLIDHLLKDCNKDGAVSRVRLYNVDAHDTIVDMDQAVQNRWVLYDLRHEAITNRTHAAQKLKEDLPDKALLDAILSQIKPYSAVYGWGNPGEDDFIRSLNRHTLVGECSGVPNNSFFAAMPWPKEYAFKQKRQHRTPADVTVEKKIYVAFMVNEGDSIKCMNAFQGFGSWLQQERGWIPINWGVEPNLCSSHPALMAYYYETATTNDYFFAPPSGWGYTHPGFLPKAHWLEYAGKVKEGMTLADLRFIDIWWLGELRREKQLDLFLKTAGVWGLTDWDGSQQRMLYTADNIPIAKSHHYYTYKEEPEVFAQKFLEETREVEGPWFVVIYGADSHGTPHRFYELAKRLPKDRYKVVALDEFFAAAVNARKEVEDRVLKPGKGIIKGVAP